MYTHVVRSRNPGRTAGARHDIYEVPVRVPVSQSPSVRRIVFHHVRPPRGTSWFEISPSHVAFEVSSCFRARLFFLLQTTPMRLPTSFHGVLTTARHDTRASHRTFYAGKCPVWKHCAGPPATIPRIRRSDLLAYPMDATRIPNSPTVGTIEMHVKYCP